MERTLVPLDDGERACALTVLEAVAMSDSASFMQSSDTFWPDSMTWDLGDGVTATQAQLRAQA